MASSIYIAESIPIRAHPYVGWSLIAALLATGVALIFLILTSVNPVWIYLVSMNIASLLLFGYDKQMARVKDAERIPNRVLFGLALVGGSLGSLLGIYGLHHKTSRQYFPHRVFVWLLLAVYAVALFYGLFVW